MDPLIHIEPHLLPKLATFSIDQIRICQLVLVEKLRSEIVICLLSISVFSVQSIHML